MSVISPLPALVSASTKLTTGNSYTCYATIKLSENAQKYYVYGADFTILDFDLEEVEVVGRSATQLRIKKVFPPAKTLIDQTTITGIPLPEAGETPASLDTDRIALDNHLDLVSAQWLHSGGSFVPEDEAFRAGWDYELRLKVAPENSTYVADLDRSKSK